MDQSSLIPGLFRSEYRKIVAVLCRRFGFAQMEVAEDLASETFLAAAQSWPGHGIPENPTAWLFVVAKNKAKNYLLRENNFRNHIIPDLVNVTGITDTAELDLSAAHIQDSQLRMMFAICDPVLSPEAQIGLVLRILCGFGIDEIADAFLSNRETIQKRLYRARQQLRESGIQLDTLTEERMKERLDRVLTSIYLLFNEGYYSSTNDQVMRKDLCLEAIRLCQLLIDSPAFNQPEVYALLALLCFQASRLEARIGRQGEIILYDEQDPQLWNVALINKGVESLQHSARGDQFSKYHLEAAIAYWSTQQSDTPEKWQSILQLYDYLLQLTWSPVAALNRVYALSRCVGKAEAIKAAEELKLEDQHFYFVLLGELYTGIADHTAREHFQRALSMARTSTDKQAIQRKLDTFGNAKIIR